MSPDQRIQHSGCPYFDQLRFSDRQQVIDTETAPTVLSYIGSLLEKTMESLEVGNFDFAAYMKAAINEAAEHDRKAILQHRTRMSPADERKKLDELEKKREAHLRLFSEEEHAKLLAIKIRKLSFKATMAVVFVQSFRLQPAIAPLYCLITRLVDIDELMGQWRHRHSAMVLRMIGSRSGTGGSSGHAYLEAVLQRSRIFTDLTHASHYLLPQHALPPLPRAVSVKTTVPA
mmetsp:Transcript_3567/g.10473  ORF Transcript_3567/g.10473 Transcript_3567/m.10473 type:complete len:231 (+) Transcript_3567:1094-1786(+)